MPPAARWWGPRATRSQGRAPRRAPSRRLAAGALAAAAVVAVAVSALALRDDQPPSPKPVAASTARPPRGRRVIGASAREHSLGRPVRLRTRPPGRRRRGPLGLAPAPERAANPAHRHAHARAEGRGQAPVGLARPARRGRRLCLGGSGRRARARAHLDLERPARPLSPGGLARDRAHRRRGDAVRSGARARSPGSFPETASPGGTSRTTAAGRITFGDGALWSLEDPGVLRKLDPETGRELAQIDLHATVSDVAVGGGRVWASVVPDGVVYALDESNLRVRRRLASGPDPERISFAAGRLWIANSAAGTVTSLDPRTGARTRLSIGALPTSVAYGNGVVWAGTVPEPPPLPPAGGPELRLSFPGEYLTLDPAASHSTADEQLEEATCAGLLAYPDAAGPAGKRLRPEVAAAMPRVSADGRTYTFRIRRGFRFSPPSHEAVTAATFKHTLERAFSPKLGSGGRGQSEAPAIEGLPAFLAGKAAHVSGIRASGETLSITLVRPSGDFLGRISLPHLCPVPLSAPIRPADARRRTAVVGSVLRLLDRGRARRAAAQPGLRRPPAAALGADRLHARRPHARKRWRSSIAASSTTCRSTSTAGPCSIVGACSIGASGPAATPRARGPAPLPHHGAVPRLHRAQRRTDRSSATCGSGAPSTTHSTVRSSRPHFTTRRATRSSHRASTAFRQARCIRSTGPTSRSPDGSPAIDAGTRFSRTARSSRTATTAFARSHRV